MESTTEEFLPLSRAAVLHRMSRERLLRRVQSGDVRGEMRDGRWYVAAPEEPADKQ